ncbi:Elongation factor Ts, chloroplastic [Apostasia shenzhenica]|uniref:Elongation factor Ts, mitochondrial n=1 Tax=Apostasia shenzhenica TaxID=1088818 RepID=A0A2I0AVZ3_9ASPA|nr:Elongation factor Ts, chloroplastic [Apostasia shenzhenica]
MTSLLQCSVGNISLFPCSTFIYSRKLQIPKFNASKKQVKWISTIKGNVSSQSLLQLSKINRFCFISKRVLKGHLIAAVGTDVSVEDPNPSVSGDAGVETKESSSISAEASGTAAENPASTPTPRGKRPRKSEMPPVNDEELIPGASFTGKVRAIQPFGAFIDIGAFTDGLVHVSRISDDFVKDVGAVVSIGQEVKVKVVDVNKETGRISLTMRDGDGSSKTQQRKEATASGSGDKPRPIRKNASRSNEKRDKVQKSTKFVKGQSLDGIVKNITRSGSFISLPDGEEGFLPLSEESDGLGGVLGNSSLQIGQEVKVRVLRISRGQTTLTMKTEEHVDALNRQLNLGVVHVATNPFELAFRQNKEISTFLDDRERLQKKNSTMGGEKVDVLSELVLEDVSSTAEAVREENSAVESISDDSFGSDVDHISDSPEKSVSSPESSAVDGIVSDELHDTVSSADSGDLNVANDVSSISVAEEDNDLNLSVFKDESKSSAEHGHGNVVASSAEIPKTEGVSIASDSEQSSIPTITAEDDEKAKSSNAIEIMNSAAEFIQGDSISIDVDHIRDSHEDSVSSSEGSAENETRAVERSSSIASDEAYDKVISADSANLNLANIVSFVGDTKDVSIPSEFEQSSIPTMTVSEHDDKSKSSNALNIISDGAKTCENPATAEEKQNEFPDLTVSQETESSEKHVQPYDENVSITQSNLTTISGKMDKEPARSFEVENPESDDVKIEGSETPSDQSGIPHQESAVKAISPSLVKQLREETGAGMMDCKRALSETDGDIEKAHEFLRKKGLASADKKASRATAEGRIGSYIHDSRIGVLIEVNCETDFVSRGEIFQQLVDDLAMQVAAFPQVCYLVPEDVPEEIVIKEREIEMQKDDLLTKPEQIRPKIVEGRVNKRLAEFALLEQPYIKNDKMVVKDWIKQTISTVGENIKVKRFIRYNLGEGLEKKIQNLAAEVAAQTAAKPSPCTPIDPSSESKETIEKQPAPAISASLVKQLREETGAGMMDCKKALSETGGDLEKAHEYLRKKGLSSADKKFSRLAAEGRISSYIHDSRIGCMIEVNSETDFVGRNEKFIELVDTLAMQVVACPQVEYVSVEEIPESIVNKEKEIEMQREDLQSKPEQTREKIVQGRISKRLGELALLNQPFIRDDSILVKDLVKQTVASLGENIKVRRFVRYTLGETQ